MDDSAKELVARVGVQQKISYTVTPQPDALIPADSLGGQLVALSDLFSALGERDGYKLKTLVSNIGMGADGAISFELTILPLEVVAPAASTDKKEGK